MLEFKSISLSDKEILEEFLKISNDFSCENTFVNLYVWQGAYNNQIAIKNENLFIKYGTENNERFCFPIGGDLEEGLKEIFDCCGNSLPVFWSPINETFSRLPRWFNEMYDIKPTRDAFDYIYLREDLANLSGKKYHSKRNHISAFSKKYDWRYEDITSENLSSVALCSEKWYTQNADRLDKYADFEKRGIETVLQNMEALNVTGGAILVNGEVVAFTLGTPINDSVFDVFAEKALPDFAEGYAVINNEFAKHLSQYRYINREDDMGLEGLRRAKLSYKPAVLLEKYMFIPKQNESEIYRKAFGVDTEFETDLFSLCSSYLKTLKVDNKTVSMLFALPCSLVNGEERIDATYIFAAATDENYRKKGYMEKLLKETLKENDNPIILRPANEKLIKYYKKFGFTEFSANDIKAEGLKLVPKDGFLNLSEKTDLSDDGKFTAMVLNCDLDLNGLYFPYSMP